jgi:hypothetical protein
MWVNCRASVGRVFGNSAWGGEYRAKITSLIWQVLDLNFSQSNFLRTQDPIGQGVRASKKPYSAFFLGLAGLGSWWQFKTNVAFFSS